MSQQTPNILTEPKRPPSSPVSAASRADSSASVLQSCQSVVDNALTALIAVPEEGDNSTRKLIQLGRQWCRDRLNTYPGEQSESATDCWIHTDKTSGPNGTGYIRDNIAYAWRRAWREDWRTVQHSSSCHRQYMPEAVSRALQKRKGPRGSVTIASEIGFHSHTFGMFYPGARPAKLPIKLAHYFAKSSRSPSPEPSWQALTDQTMDADKDSLQDCFSDDDLEDQLTDVPDQPSQLPRRAGLSQPSQLRPVPQTLPFLPLTEWDPDQRYDDQPPSYIHYALEWKMTLLSLLGDVSIVQDIALAPGDFWDHTLRPELERLVEKTRSNEPCKADATTITMSVTDRSERDITKRFDELMID
ncbi:unnamed protein product [Fusarium graminearum]|uniref:Chromosome 4, complete genome n=1 Tax=Gibberella zeae (strain ATCC MYA-4620 / CBS 123657 / FGSC 9075 / NRRL 31084 / PH-1) TaxID=229533 RepID=A0A098DWT2_GIBZE|nr:unnamed protein product [Fusarium graminearum]